MGSNGNVPSGRTSATGLNSVPSGERITIGLFGRRNAGKSSLLNVILGQEMAIVSDVPGTTTDPVSKAMELLPLGPVQVIDTPGADDEGELGEKRVQQTIRTLRKCDIAILVIDASEGVSDADTELLFLIGERNVPAIAVLNKADVAGNLTGQVEELEALGVPVTRIIEASATESLGIDAVKEALGSIADELPKERRALDGLASPGDIVVLVIPVDDSAPKGRIILPQQMVLRELLDMGACAIACQPDELPMVLPNQVQPPVLVITDSQAFGKVARLVPEDLPLTSFSILMARKKGDLPFLIEGARKLEQLADGDRVLISEGCTHHRQCEDIGTVKIPRWIEEFTGAHPTFDLSSGGGFPDDLDSFDLVIHCGACMLNEREMAHRMSMAREAGVPMVNYGIAIAHMHGILERSLAPIVAAS